MKCPHCGSHNFNWAKRCDDCRRPLSALPTETPTNQQTKPPSISCYLERLDPAERDTQVQAITDRMQTILASGQKPEWVFLCDMGNGGTLLLTPPDGTKSLLLFTSPLLALDYLRAVGKQGNVAGVPINSLAEFCQTWRKLGADSLCLNRCPRCSGWVVTFPLDGFKSHDSFLKFWALEHASRFVKGQGFARTVLNAQTQGLTQMKLALETLRDHAAADNAHVYQLLAMIALAQKDAEARAAALTRLNEFQAPVTFETDDAARGFSEGIVGLLATYELLRFPNPPPS